MMANTVIQAIDEGYTIGREPSEIITHLDECLAHKAAVPGLEQWEICGQQTFGSEDEKFFWQFMRPQGILDEPWNSEDVKQNGKDFWFYCQADGKLLHYGWSYKGCSFEPNEIVEHQDLEGGLYRFKVLACKTFYAVGPADDLLPTERIHRVTVEALPDEG